MFLFEKIFKHYYKKSNYKKDDLVKLNTNV